MPADASLPTEISVEKSMPRAWPRENSVPMTLPLCDSTAMRPAPSRSARNAALVVQAKPERVATTPVEFGPIRRMPASRAIRVSRAWRSRPSAPASAKPSASIETTRTPAAAHSARLSIAASVSSRM